MHELGIKQYRSSAYHPESQGALERFLKMSRGKMKARYDNHVIDRKFKPGDKVLALLPIPGRPLKARYFGPYTIDKKTSDLNYIINTPGRRKNKRMCHVNMLKEYFDRDSSISKPITVVNTVPQESNVFEPEVNSDFIDEYNRIQYNTIQYFIEVFRPLAHIP